MAPGRGLSAIWPSKFEWSISVHTAVCQGPQSCLPESKGISLVEGKVDFEEKVLLLGEETEIVE